MMCQLIILRFIDFVWFMLILVHFSVFALHIRHKMKIFASRMSPYLNHIYTALCPYVACPRPFRDRWKHMLSNFYCTQKNVLSCYCGFIYCSHFYVDKQIVRCLLIFEFAVFIPIIFNILSWYTIFHDLIIPTTTT
jgi:hypothetical protein